MILAVDRTPYSAEWLARWRDGLTSALTSLLPAFAQTYGYEPDTNEVRAANDEDLRALRTLRGRAAGPALCEALLTFYESISVVTLPDVGNGHFIHPAHDVLHDLAESGAVFLSEARNPHGTVFASNGGGLLYAIDSHGAVHRSDSASWHSDFSKIADDMPHFLEQLRSHVASFAKPNSSPPALEADLEQAR
ncbi:hypothetical protein AB0948_19325 [Streptomyces koyangensis]|uniref:hypothetical protein n=1 Tax=Streptomyces koyangensis TaxID=188770 RepID=UPI0034552373